MLKVLSIDASAFGQLAVPQSELDEVFSDARDQKSWSRLWGHPWSSAAESARSNPIVMGDVLKLNSP